MSDVLTFVLLLVLSLECSFVLKNFRSFSFQPQLFLFERISLQIVPSYLKIRLWLVSYCDCSCWFVGCLCFRGLPMRFTFIISGSRRISFATYSTISLLTTARP